MNRHRILGEGASFQHCISRTIERRFLFHDTEKRKFRQIMRKLEAFPNQHPDRRYTVTLVCPEFTCICPITGQPDFATITIEYIPGEICVESKFFFRFNDATCANISKYGS